jgi:hypothetical protein
MAMTDDEAGKTLAAHHPKRYHGNGGAAATMASVAMR